VSRLVIIGCLLAGCEGLFPALDLERMIDQPSLRPYEASSFFPDGRAMQTPPEGTLARGRVVGDPTLGDGFADGRYVASIPIPVDLALVQRGRTRFDIYCAACHGARGDGVSEVARNMELRAPPSLLKPNIRAYPDGRIYRTATVGYGLMPSYGAELDDRDRWAVVAYLRALQLSQSARLADLPPSVRSAATRLLP
jgi:mono/diheme cytochrome c family protein